MKQKQERTLQKMLQTANTPAHEYMQFSTELITMSTEAFAILGRYAA